MSLHPPITVISKELAFQKLMLMGGIAPFGNFKGTEWRNGLNSLCSIIDVSLEKRLQEMGAQENWNQDSKNKYKEKKMYFKNLQSEDWLKINDTDETDLEMFGSWVHLVPGWLVDINPNWYSERQHTVRRRDNKWCPAHIKCDMHLSFHMDMLIR